MNENRILPADELPEENDLNDALVRDGKDAILPAEQDEKKADVFTCPRGNHPIFTYPSGKIVPHMDAGGCEYTASGTQYPPETEPFIAASASGLQQIVDRFFEPSPVGTEWLASSVREQARRMLESAESRLAGLSAIVEPLRELWDKRTKVTDFYVCEAANEEYEEAALNSVSRLLALVPPVEKGEK